MANIFPALRTTVRHWRAASRSSVTRTIIGRSGTTKGHSGPAKTLLCSSTEYRRVARSWFQSNSILTLTVSLMGTWMMNVTAQIFTFDPSSLSYNGRRTCPILRAEIIERQSELHSDRSVSSGSLPGRRPHWHGQGP